MPRTIAVYIRVSSKAQDHRSQIPDLERWLKAFADDEPVQWYRDKASGKTMNRSGWKQLEQDLALGKISKILVWRLDRLGRTAAGLTELFERLQRLAVGFVSVRDQIDLSTAAGRLMANVLASVAAYENEVRAERIRAGQEAARKRGKTWGGSKAGRRLTVTREQEQTVRRLHKDGEPIAGIARAVGLSRPTVYRLIGES